MRKIKFPLPCVGCKAQLFIEGPKPALGKGSKWVVECPNCGSQLAGHMVRPAFPEFKNQLRVGIETIRVSDKLKAMLKSGEVTGDGAILAPQQPLIIPGATHADRQKMADEAN